MKGTGHIDPNSRSQSGAILRAILTMKKGTRFTMDVLVDKLKDEGNDTIGPRQIVGFIRRTDGRYVMMVERKRPYVYQTLIGLEDTDYET